MIPRFSRKRLEKTFQVVYNGLTCGEKWGKVGKYSTNVLFPASTAYDCGVGPKANVSTSHVPGRIRAQHGRQGAFGGACAIPGGVGRGGRSHTRFRPLSDGLSTADVGAAGPASQR